jgi:hypothetical protein
MALAFNNNYNSHNSIKHVMKKLHWLNVVQMMRKDRMNMIQTTLSFLNGWMLKLIAMDLVYPILVTTIAWRGGK